MYIRELNFVRTRPIEEKTFSFSVGSSRICCAQQTGVHRMIGSNYLCTMGRRGSLSNLAGQNSGDARVTCHYRQVICYTRLVYARALLPLI
jgi:hypothetical protein